MSELIKRLGRESYPTATSQEIGMAINESPAVVRAVLSRKGADDNREYVRRREPGVDHKLIRIMKRRIGIRGEAAA